METRVKISQFTQQKKALLINFGRQSFASNIFGSESIANHNIALFLLNYEIWLNQWKNIIQHWSSSLPVINWARKFLFTCPSITRVLRSTECGFEPNNKLLITTGYLETRMPLITVAVFALFCVANINATLTVDKTSKISNFCNSVISFEVNNFTHKYPFVNNYTVINEKVHAERLNEKGPRDRVCDSLNSDRKTEREIRRGFSA